MKDQQEKLFEELQQEATQKGIAVIRTPTGFVMAPARGDAVLSPEEFEKLPESEHHKIQSSITELQDKLRNTLERMPRYEHPLQETARSLL